MTEDIQFKNKYLKYKNKYISLKKSVEQNRGITGRSSQENKIILEKIFAVSLDLITDNFIKSISQEEDIHMFNQLIYLYQKKYPDAYRIFYDPSEGQSLMFPYYDTRTPSIILFLKGFKNINLLRIAVATCKSKIVKDLLKLAPVDIWDLYPINTPDNKQIKTLQLQEFILSRVQEGMKKYEGTPQILIGRKLVDELKQIRSILIQHGFKPEMKGLFNPTPVNPQDAEDWKIYLREK